MTRTVPLRELAQIDLAGNRPAVFLLAVDYDQAGPGQRAVVVRGIAPQVASVVVTVASSAGSASATQPTANGGHFAAALTIAVAGPHDFLLVAASDAQPAAGSPAAFDRCVAPLGGPAVLSPPDAVLANFDVARLQYLAGTPDRIIPSRTYVQINLPLQLHLLATVTTLYVATEDPADPVMALPSKRLAAFDKALHELSKRLAGKDLDVAAYYKEAGKVLTETLQAGAKPATPDQASLIRRELSHFAGPKPKAKAATAASTPSPTMLRFTEGKQQSLYWKPGKDWSDLANWWMQLLQRTQRVGVLFSDRLRLQPAGLVVGEPLYKLTLSPGEEVQLRQTSETRKRHSLQEIRDRESEETLTLSSTLSTDLTTTISESRSFQSQLSLGGGIDGTIPETPIGVSVNAGSNATSANDSSTTETATFHHETASQSMARLRAQHKTVLEISTEQTTGYSTTRTLRNNNPQRAQIHTFFKLYRKERITLERHDVQLCVRLDVNDPARDVRVSFQDAVHRIDPSNKELWDLPEYGDVPLVREKSLSEPADKPADSPWGGRHSRWATLQIADLGTFLQAPAGYVLTDSPRLRMTEVRTFTQNSDMAGAEGSHTYNDEILRTPVAGVSVQPAFVTSGGEVKWRRKPEPLHDDLQLKLDVDFAFRMQGRPPVVPFIELGSKITDVTFSVEATFGPGAALLQQRHDKILARKREAIAQFDPAAVVALAAAARADFPGAVLDIAIREHFPGLSLDRMRTFARVFELDKMLVETVPYWGSREASDAHFQLKYLLERMPRRVPVDDVLSPEITGAQAVVYLPIRHGLEAEALSLLEELDAAQRQELVDDFDALRNTRFAVTRPLASLTSAAMDVPTPPLATPAGAGAWSHGWERNLRQFDVLAEWSDLTPTDGLHLETQLSATVVTDEIATARLQRLDTA